MEVRRELIASELSSSIRSHDLDRCAIAMVGDQGFVSFVCNEYFILGPEESKFHLMGVFVGECDEILLPLQRCNLCRSPYISVNALTTVRGFHRQTLLGYRCPRDLRMNTGRTEFGLTGCIKDDTLDHSRCDETLGDVGVNMTHDAMKLHDGHLLRSCESGLRPLSLVVSRDAIESFRFRYLRDDSVLGN